MPFPLFQLHSPILLPSIESSSSFQAEEQLSPPPTAQDLVGTWHMIASSSSMWQDRKKSITITYSTLADGGNSHRLNDVTAWYTDNSTKQTSTKGSSYPSAAESGYAWDWRGAGWLRLITTRWEILGLGVMSNLFYANSADLEERVCEANKNGVVVLVTFAQKTVFSPQAISVFIQQEQLHSVPKENVVKSVMAMLRALGVESLCAEIAKLKTIHQNGSG